jgi:aminoglycoside phosphotransferase (APT) family kinase protein
MNYRLNQGDFDWVLRVNIGTQIGRADQIDYEYKTLRLLENTGVTPRAYFVDDSRQYLPYGILVMEYLPGETMDYRVDLEAVARLFARIHGWQVEKNHLIIEDRPLSMTYDECKRL